MTSSAASSSSTSSSAPPSDRFSAIRCVYGDETFAKVRAAKVLVVGAGGIGCELLKNLVLSGYQNITSLDLDTIDVSNLNRQFLFRREHVGKSKAIIARESVLRLVPDAQIEAIHGNIKDAQYDHDWFQQFTLVMNALDNLDARRHVNRLCLSAERTLLESGTQGYAGQASVIRGSTTECFECQPIPTPKTFAVCTIRNTPDQPVHTIVWAKALYAALVGPPDDGNIMSDAKMDLQDGVKEAQEKEAHFATSDPYQLSSYSKFAQNIFTKLYTDEIVKQCEIKERWKSRRAPIPADLPTLFEQLRSASAKVEISCRAYRTRDQTVMTSAENAAYFLRIIDSLLATRSDQIGDLVFDKDDEASMDFVACAANLRMANFHIPVQSRFALKGIAGNIVHAIATTNAIAAGLMVVESIKILEGRLKECHTTWITRSAPGLLTSQDLSAPNPKCFVCATSILELSLDTEKWTLKRLYESVLKKKLSMNEPSIDVLNRDNFIGTIDDHEEENPSYLLLPLSSSGVRVNHGALLQVEDQSQKLSVSLRIRQRSEWDEEKEPDEFTITGELHSHANADGNEDADDAMNDTEEEKKDVTSAAASNGSHADDTTMAESTKAASSSSSSSSSSISGNKRKQPASEESEDEKPKGKAQKREENGDEPIELD